METDLQNIWLLFAQMFPHWKHKRHETLLTRERKQCILYNESKHYFKLGNYEASVCHMTLFFHLLSIAWTSMLFLCRSCTIVCQGTCTRWPVAASWKWCILGTTQWGSGPPRWLGTDPGPSPRTSTSRMQVSLHLPQRQTKALSQILTTYKFCAVCTTHYHQSVLSRCRLSFTETH